MIAQHPVATLFLEYPAWLTVWYYDLRISVYVSNNVWLNTSRQYAPVRQLLADTGAVLLTEELIEDPAMMGGKVRILTYETERSPSVLETRAA